MGSSFSASSSTSGLTIYNGKMLTVHNSVTLSGTDGSTLNFGNGGTLGTAAFTNAGAYTPVGSFQFLDALTSAHIVDDMNPHDVTADQVGAVPTGRILTINGTALDLSADRSWTQNWADETLNRVKVGRDFTISGVATTTEIFTTSTTHDLVTGEQVFITSTGTLPSPLVALTRYFVRDVTATDFKLSATSSTLKTVSGISGNTLTSAAHGYATNNIVYITSTVSVPSPLSQTTPYYVIYVDANTLKLSATLSGSEITLTNTGSGTIYLSTTAPINITTAGTGTIKVQRNYYGAGNKSSAIIGNGNILNSSALYGSNSAVIGSNNTSTNLGATFYVGVNNACGSVNFGIVAAIGSNTTTQASSGGVALALGDLHVIRGNCNIGIGYHNVIEDDPQGAVAIGAGCYGYWQGTLHQVSHATSGDLGQGIGTLRLANTGHAGGDLYIPITNYNTASSHMWLKGRRLYNITLDGMVCTRALNSTGFMSFCRRLVVRQANYDIGNGRAANIDSISGSTITATAHGFVNTNVVYITSTNTVPTPLDPNVGYYVVSAATDTLQLSLTSGGAAIVLSDVGVGTMNLSANPPPQILNNSTLASDVGSNGGALPVGWTYRIVPYNMVITAAMAMRLPTGANYAGAFPTSLPTVRVYANVPADATGYFGAARFHTIEGLAF